MAAENKEDISPVISKGAEKEDQSHDLIAQNAARVSPVDAGSEKLGERRPDTPSPISAANRRGNDDHQNTNAVLDVPTASAEAKLREAIIRKYDLRLMPTCFLTFLFFFLDKSNIAFARINGLEEDLGLTSSQFNVALVLFFVSNLLFAIPGNLALRRVGGGTWLPLLIVSWGIVTTFSGFVTNFAGLAATRVFLGLAESSFLGGLLIYLGFFYTQDELVSRVGIFYSSTPLAGSLGGLLAGGLGRIRVSGYNGWPWILFIEGLLTVMLGIGAYFLLPNTPREAKFLSSEERILAIQRMLDQDRKHYVSAAAQSDAENGTSAASVTKTEPKADPDQLGMATVKRAICNFMTIAMAIGAFFSLEAIYSYALFLPTIVHTMGYQALQATLMTVPPNFVGFLFTLGICFWSQRTRTTAAFLQLCAVLGMLGYMFLLIGGQVGNPPTYIVTPVQYTGTFLVAMSVNAVPPLALTWMTVNASPHYVRAIALGFVLMVGNMAAFLASFTYIRTEAPAYTRGHSINLGCLTGLLILSIVVPIWMRFENRKRERGDRDYRLDGSRYQGTITREQHELQLGWLHPSYRYKI